MSSAKSLLSRTLWRFARCAAACFMLTAPLFYLLTKYYYAEDMVDIIEAVERGEHLPQVDLEEDVMYGMMLQFLLIFAVITLAMFITMRLSTKKLWHSFDDTLCKAEHFSLAQGVVPEFLNTDIREFARLNHSLEQLMRKDQETYRIQKEFTENASHELQTPLAVIRAKLDLLMQGSLGKDEMQLVSDLYALTMRMEHLNRNLLLLARIENDQYGTLEQTDVAQVLADSLPLYEALRSGGHLQMRDERQDRARRVQANPILLECLLKNLIVNAIRHSRDDSDIEVLVSDDFLMVSNVSSDGVALDASTLFQRFRSGDSRQKGNGLGLAIVKAVCDFHHWTVHYRFESGCHQFVVRF